MCQEDISFTKRVRLLSLVFGLAAVNSHLLTALFSPAHRSIYHVSAWLLYNKQTIP